MPLNWSNYDLVVIDESHNFRNNDAFKDRETRYQKLMNSVIKQGVRTKVLMLSATPVNNRFNDLRNQLALAFEGDSENLSKRLKTTKDIETIFSKAQASFNVWSTLPAEQRLKAQVERLGLLRSKQNECRKMEARLQKEQQFNRKVELNAQLRALQAELEKLKSIA